MKYPWSTLGVRLCALALCLAASPLGAALAPPASLAKPKLGNMVDVRVNLPAELKIAAEPRSAEAVAGRAVAARELKAMAQAAARAQRSMPGLEVRYSDLTGGVAEVRNKTGALTGAAPGVSSEAIVRDFLARNGSIYGLAAADLSDLVSLGDSSGQDSGLRMLRMEQRIDGRPVFQSETRFLLDPEGKLFSSLGWMVPNARAKVSKLKVGAGLTAPEAMARLLVADGKVGNAADFSVIRQREDGIFELSENDEFVLGDATAREVYFPVSPGVLVPAWALVVFTAGTEDWYALVDQETGALLWRKNIRDYASTHDARFRVYVQADGVTPADSPAPASPNASAPGAGTQFPAIAPTIVSMSVAQDIVASPNGWINDCPGGVCTANETQTLGNNTVTCLDRDGAGNNVCDTAATGVLDGNGRPTGNPDANGRNRDFLGTTPRDFQTNFLPPPQTTAADAEVGQTATGAGASGTNAFDIFRRGAVTHLFYLTNWYHDKLYRLGFDEAAGNFQLTNFSGMGLGNDRVAGDAQDGSGTNNANFATPPDGTAGRMQMFRFTGPTIDRDGGLDAEIVIHELTHGTSNRLVGNAAGLLWDSARGMGEGWSDFYALSLLNNTNADDPNSRYASGAYATYKLTANVVLTDNYVYGIRRFPFSTDNTVNPMTWADVDDVTANLSGGIAPTPLTVFFDAGGMEVHNSGEIWALTLWEVRSRIIADPAGANGDVPTGNQTTLRLVTNGLKMTPLNPTFTDARDALLNADCATSSCANEASIWGGFADRGLGYRARAPFNRAGRYVRSHQGIRESFSVPYLDVVNALTDVTVNDTAGNNNGVADPGEPLQLTVKLTNPWRAASRAVASATATLATSTPGVTIYDNASTYGAIAPQGTATGDTFLITLDSTVPCGSAIDFTLTTTSSLGTTSTTFRLRVGNRSGTDPAVTYTRNPAATIVNGLGRGVSDNLTVTDDFEIADVDFQINSVTHPAVGDLTALLRSPEGIGTDLVALIDGLNDLGGTSITNMVIDDDVTNDAAHDMVQATTANSPYTASWRPVYNSPWAALVNPAVPGDPNPNLAFFDGSSTLGTWSTVFADVFTAAAGGTDGNGTLASWSIVVTPVHFVCSAFAPAGDVVATKTVSGTFTVGGTVTYTVTLTNNGTDGQADNAGNEFSDTLPAGLTLVSATATSGTATANGSPNLVTWNGTLAPLGGSVTITITATINAGTQGQTITNQGSTSYDSNNDNTNDASHLTDDPGVGGATDPTSFVVGSSAVSGTKTVSGTFNPGGTVTYIVTLSNTGGTASPDNAGNEFTDALPAGLTLVSASATSGTASTAGNTANWSGSIPAGGNVTITITATINAGTQGQTISNQGSFAYDADLNGSNESTGTTDDPTVGGANDPTSFSVGGATLAATKTASGTFQPGSTVTYTIVISNSGPSASADNAGDELTDVLPAALQLVNATATAGTATPNTGTNTVTWSGSVPGNGSVTITITATVRAGFEGSTVTNQGTLAYDADGNGSNETTVQTDDPAQGGATDPTSFVVLPGTPTEVPTLGEAGLAALTLALLAAAWATLRRRKTAF